VSPLLEVDHVSVLIGGGEAVRDVSLSVDSGEIVALLGANGAGKTTTLRTISGLNHCHRGSIRYDGEDISRLAPHVVSSRGIGHVPEGRRLFSRMTVRENLELGAYTRRQATMDIDGVLGLFPELSPLLNRLAYSLSGGEQQMVAFGRALMAAPRVVMLDEPSLGLAPVVVTRIMEAVRSLRDADTAVLLVEQDTAVALDSCDRAYVLVNGVTTFSGSREEINANEEIRKAYLG
jgi:branched-chain amino acid transport system ATP-binding protein